MVEGSDLFVIPERWTGDNYGFPIHLTVAPPEPGEAFYRISGEMLGSLLRTAGFEPEGEE